MSNASVIDVDAVVTLLCRLIASLDASEPIDDGWLDILPLGNNAGAAALPDASEYVLYASDGSKSGGCKKPSSIRCRFAALFESGSVLDASFEMNASGSYIWISAGGGGFDVAAPLGGQADVVP
ncbi:hypothetical protein Tdes44962_MAKER05707 [Teratosphaeria destructans]|uniref:Uncharacterized protein n=1 Tax=Teratosphaeria destructans TaxID=418781 RepID=A0A9W7SJ93_9PEZI|nr:hypothetical protein Tdes44962_MAKER05707 [Teratosphaeria destructans]